MSIGQYKLVVKCLNIEEHVLNSVSVAFVCLAVQLSVEQICEYWDNHLRHCLTAVGLWILESMLDIQHKHTREAFKIDNMFWLL